MSAGDQAEAARQEYNAQINAIETRFGEDFATIEGDYTRTTQYAGLVRTELLNSAKMRRAAALEVAWTAFQAAIHQVGGTTAPQPPTAQEETADDA